MTSARGNAPYTKGWRPSPDGYVRIPFWVNRNPLPGGDGVRPEQIEGALLSAIRTWSAYSPQLCFIKEGYTDRRPLRAGDGYSDFGLGGEVSFEFDEEGYIIEADIVGYVGNNHYTWTPCEQRDNSCTPTGSSKEEIENLMAHELGHVLGLFHPPDEFGDHRLLTMGFADKDDNDPSSRFRNSVTLGLGDVLGLRHLYPCDCPIPPIYDP